MISALAIGAALASSVAACSSSPSGESTGTSSASLPLTTVSATNTAQLVEGATTWNFYELTDGMGFRAVAVDKDGAPKAEIRMTYTAAETRDKDMVEIESVYPARGRASFVGEMGVENTFDEHGRALIGAMGADVKASPIADPGTETQSEQPYSIKCIIKFAQMVTICGGAVADCIATSWTVVGIAGCGGLGGGCTWIIHDYACNCTNLKHNHNWC
jgi:hypothetical protein